MRLFHLAGCVVRAVRVVPMAAITSVILTFGLLQGGGQFTMLMHSSTGRLFVYGFAGIFLLSIVAGMGKRRRELGCFMLGVAIVPFILLGALTAYVTSGIVTVFLDAGPATEGASFLQRFWATITTFPTAVQIPTIVGAFLGFLGLVGESSDNSD